MTDDSSGKDVGDWQPMDAAPKDRSEILLWLGETWPDHFDVRVGSFVTGSEAEEMGYREYAKYGGWMIVHSGGEDWFLIDVSEPLGWFHLPRTSAYRKHKGSAHV